MIGFDYHDAFSRNIGWITPKEQLILKDKIVAIAGMGSVGAAHLLSLCRLGIQHFRIADSNQFELTHFNRQLGANITTLDKPQNQTLMDMAKNINPQVQIQSVDNINHDNVTDFLSGCDLYMDGMDFFDVDAREMLFVTCEKLNIPAIMAMPLGMGVNYLIFDSKGMSFMRYFQWQNKTEQQKLINFALGLAPKPWHLSYLVDPSSINFKLKKEPSTVMSYNLCAGVASVMALKILLNRGNIKSAPYYHIFDPYLGKYKTGYLPWGNKNPLQLLKQRLMVKIIGNQALNQQEPSTQAKTSELEKILDLARWAPSEDNIQPWCFEIISEKKLIINILSPLQDNLFDFGEKTTFIATGCLLESLKLAANQFGKALVWKILDDQNQIEVTLERKTRDKDPLHLVDFLKYRCVDRGLYQKEPVPLPLFKQMETLLDQGYELKTFTDKKSKKQIININRIGTQIRLLLEKTHKVYRHIFQLDKDKTDNLNQYTALSLSPITNTLGKLFFNHSKVMNFINDKLGGIYLASYETDYLPGHHSAGYFAIKASKSLDSMDANDLISAGMQIQRLWLYLTKMNLVIQPCFVSIFFSYCDRNQIAISDKEKINNKLKELVHQFNNVGFCDKTIFIARIGYAKMEQKKNRAKRLTLEQLIMAKKE